jgi:glycosyltransferase involved in cell wall biosynthesis
MPPRKILLLIESSETGGAESVVAELAERLDRTRFTPIVGVLRDGWLVSRIRSIGLEPVVVPSGSGGFDHRLLRGIRRLVGERGIALVHSHLFTTNVYASVACVGTGVPVVSTFHGIGDVAAGDRSKRLKWAALNRCSRSIVFVSRYLQGHFVATGLATRSASEVVYNGVDLARLGGATTRDDARADLGVASDAFVVGCVGDLRPPKDYGTALRAAAILRDAIPGLRVLIAGSTTGLLDELLELRDRLGLAAVVEFVGFQPRIERFFPALDCYLTTSISEGFSLTVVEAMAAGVPVVATRSGGPEEIVTDGVSGLLAPVGDPEAIAAAILRLRNDPALADRLRAAGRDEARARFSVSAMVASYESLYERVLGGT